MTPRTTPVALVAGGLWETIGADEFWERPGIAPAMRTLGYDVRTLARLDRPCSWPDDGHHLAHALDAGGGGPVAVVAASNGCSGALRLAIDRPDLVSQLVLCWPATGDDPSVDRIMQTRLLATGAGERTVAQLLDGELVRGVSVAELRAFDRSVVLVPAEPDDTAHSLRTVAGLRRLLPRAAIGLGTPPSVSPSFAGHLGALVALLDVALFG